MKTDGIILDIDGTLWDSTGTCARAWNDCIKKYTNLPPTVTADQLKEQFGKPMDEIFHNLFPDITQEELNILQRTCEREENEILPKYPGKVYPGVVETIKKAADSVPLFIVSNCQVGYIETTTDCLGVSELIRDKICFGENPVSKGENIRLIVSRNDLKHPVYVGDTEGDQRACREAGIPFVFAAYGFGTVNDPEFTIHKFDEILRVLF